MSYSSEVLADAPAIYLRLGEASGTTAFDSSGNARNGTYSATGNTKGQTGLLVGDPDKAVLFADVGSPGKVSVPANETLTAFTIETWVKTTIYGGQFVQRYGTRRIFWLQTAADVPSFTLWKAGGQTTITGPAYTHGVPHHMVGTYDGTTMRLYVDGVQKATSTAISGTLDNGSGEPLIAGNFFDGTLDEIAYYLTALSAARVLAHYTAGTTLPPPGTPTSLAVTPAITTAALTWAAPAGGTTPTGYKVRVNGGTPTDVGLVTAYTVTGLTGGTAYTLEVAAYSAAGTGAYASVSTTTLPALPGPPTALAVTPGVTSAALTWAAPASGATPTGYRVRVNGGTATDVGLVTSHTFTGLDPDTTYTLEVAAYSAGGTGAYATLPVTTLHPTDWPTDLTPGPQQWRGVHPLLTWAGVDPLVRWYDLRLCGNPTEEAKP